MMIYWINANKLNMKVHIEFLIIKANGEKMLENIL